MTGKELENSILDVSRYIGRVLTSRETQIIISVLNLGFDVESIIYALEITVNAVHDFKLNYAEKVLYNWHDNGCKNIAEVKAYEAARKRKAAQEKRSGVIFKDNRHKQRCSEIFGKMKSRDVYHATLAYLLALDDNIQGQRISECFDFSEDSIKPNVLEAAWITSTDCRVLQLAFNLWNDAQPANVSDVFGSVSDLEYLLEAVRIRFGAVELICSPR